MSIPPKKKECKKGTGKAKGFKGCNEFKYIHRYGLCSSCFGEWLYSSGDGKKLLYGAVNKAQKPRKELQAAIKENKERKGLTGLIKSTVIVFNKYIRLRDKGKPCISCLTPYMDSFQATHYHKAELYPTLKFNELNVFGGCIKCNLFLDGNLEMYGVNLPERIGQEKFNELNQLAANEKKTVHKWDREELKKIRTKYNLKIKQLKQTL